MFCIGSFYCIHAGEFRKITLENQNGVGVYPYFGIDALAALGSLGSPIYIYSFETQSICWANQPALSFWNAASADELLQRPMTPYSAPTEIRLADYRAAFRSGIVRMESWVFYPKGQATSAMCRCSGVRIDGHGEAMMVEIQRQFDLPVSDLRAIEALRHTPLMISLYSAQGEPLMHNPAALARLGSFGENLPEGKDQFRALFALPDDWQKLLDGAQRQQVALRTAKMAIDGSPTHAVQVSLVSDPVTANAAILVAQQDITKVIEISRQLAASEDSLDAVLNLNVGPTFVLSVPDDTVLKANISATRLLGGALVVGGSARAIFAAASDLQHLRDTVLQGTAGAAVVRLKLPDGRLIWAQAAGAHISFETNDAIVISLSDIDALYRSAADLKEALSSERQTSNLQRKFLAIAAHDFRTPLAIIDSAAQRLEHNTQDMPQEMVRNRAIRIRATVKRLLLLLDNTIERARSDHASMGFAPALGDISDVLASCTQAFRDMHPQAHIELALPSLSPLEFDRALIEQMVGNVLANAIKYSNGPAQVEISASMTERDVTILFRDYGIGIPPTEREQVFLEFSRGSNISHEPGTGLGLSIVQKIAEMHGGTAEICDTAGAGTTVRIALPRP